MNINKIILWIIVLILLVSTVSAFGIKPAQKNMNYGQGIHEFRITIVNTNHRQLNLMVYPLGELKDSIIIPENSISFSEEEYTITYYLDLNKNIPPGYRTSKIIFEEIPDKIGEGLATTLNLAYKISVNVPYPDEYLESDLKVTYDDKYVNFDIGLNNLGKTSFNKIYANLEILEYGKTIHELKTNTISLDTNEQNSITTELKRSDILNGRYLAKTRINYDDNQNFLVTNFSVGRPGIGLSIPNIYYDNESTSKFDIVLESLWNEELKDVYANILISDSHYILSNITTYSLNLKPRSEESMYAYWDTRGIPYGDYFANITVFFNDEQVTKNFKVSVMSPDDVKRFRLQSTNIYFVALFIILIIIMLIFANHFFKNCKHRR